MFTTDWVSLSLSLSSERDMNRRTTDLQRNPSRCNDNVRPGIRAGSPSLSRGILVIKVAAASVVGHDADAEKCGPKRIIIARGRGPSIRHYKVIMSKGARVLFSVPTRATFSGQRRSAEIWILDVPLINYELRSRLKVPPAISASNRTSSACAVSPSLFLCC